MSEKLTNEWLKEHGWFEVENTDQKETETADEAVTVEDIDYDEGWE